MSVISQQRETQDRQDRWFTQEEDVYQQGKYQTQKCGVTREDNRHL